MVAPGEVGVGILQMVPVVAAALRKREGVLAIEQASKEVSRLGQIPVFQQPLVLDSIARRNSQPEVRPAQWPLPGCQRLKRALHVTRDFQGNRNRL